MARPIEATPVLRGQDAKAFLSETKVPEHLPVERQAWLEMLAQLSKAAEDKGKVSPR